MGILNRYIRVIVGAFLLCTISLFALKAYAGTLDAVPPLNAIVSTLDGLEQYLIDLNREQIHRYRTPHVRAVDIFGFNRPRGAVAVDIYLRRGRLVVDILDGNEPRELGVYDAAYTNPTTNWTRDGNGIYLFSETEDREALRILVLDLETGNTSEIFRIEGIREPNNVWFIDDNMLGISSATTTFFNIDTFDYTTIPVSSPHIRQYNTDDDEVIYAGRSDNDSNLIDTVNRFNYVTGAIQTVDIEAKGFAVEGFFNTLAFEPEGNYFAVMQQSGGIAIITMPEGDVTMLDNDTMRLRGAWSSDGEWLPLIYANDAGQGGTLVAYHVPSGEQVILAERSNYNQEEHRVSWSPAGNYALVYRASNQNQFQVAQNLEIKIFDIQTETISYQGFTKMPIPGFVFLSWNSVWFDAKYPE